VESAQPTALTTTLTRTIVYTYDNLYRLTNATYSTGEVFTYTYDPAGNRKTQTTLAGTTVYTYDAANRLTQVDGQSYTWDNNGNLLNDGSRTFTYDTENRLTSVVSGGITSTFKYNGDGDRYAETVNGVTTDYVLDPVGLAQVLMETTGGQSKHYLPGLAQYDTANGWQYVTSDRVGSVRLLVKPNGEVALSQSFDPFGNVLERTGTGQSSFGYTGEQTDPTGLVFLRARYYDPRVGRFLTADSVVPDPLRSQDWNRYAYVRNNPVKYNDPSGHCIFGLDTLVCVVVGGVVLGVAVLDAVDIGTSVYTFNFDANASAAEREAAQLNIADYANGMAMENILPQCFGEGVGIAMLIGAPRGANKLRQWITKLLAKFSRSKALFRGTSVGWPGSVAMQATGVVPTSSDPLVSTLFALESASKGDGVLHIALSSDLEGVVIQPGSRGTLSALEQEFEVGINATEFASRASISISVDQARTILGDMGFELPNKISSYEELNYYMHNTPRMTSEQIGEFIQRAIELAK
jgi:RHS repeat-associated protein